MKHRLVELLQCPCCQGDLEIKDAETRPVSGASSTPFPCQRYCSLGRTSTIPAPSRCVDCGRIEIVAGTLSCGGCGRSFRIVESVPWLFELTADPSAELLSNTVSLYSHVWSTMPQSPPKEESHVEGVEEALRESVAQGTLGLDAGSGYGNDTAALARRHPSVELISLDVSQGVYETRRRTEGLANVHVVRGSVLSIPIRSGQCDFGYSFGVLHHTTDPQRGLGEIVRTLKPGGRLSLYLYEDHEENPWKAWPLKAVSAFRRLTTRLAPGVLSVLCYGLSPFVVLVFSVPARIMARYGPTRGLAEKMPFNFGTSLFSVHADLMDRFGAPIEVRYNQRQMVDLLQGGGLESLRVTKLKRAAGWVARGVKPDHRARSGHNRSPV